ncbi:exonuclease SbcCD subunit D C-terminal domain-containing protein [Myxococcota bacterium]|nr:exonuclease SbcCD subunit D C-terminal domain-containing protein [Myxococcota bacterium]MBU1535715.1 exonuclease SbcCD subunit D C-terminal domain-containing protein [Myxococcota bacterium]
MRILHTSDWHLGRSLYRQKRYDEFERFLQWLSTTIQEEEVNALLISGDIFDTGTPSNLAQELYYQFLNRVARSCCRHVVVTGGNHDSPSFLNAPAQLLQALHVHVVGCALQNPEDEVLTLLGPDGTAELIVCAVPYLRDRDIRVSQATEQIEDKERKLAQGIQDHYNAVISKAREQQTKLGAKVPLVVMGHLFTTGAQTIDGDGVRELYVGSLSRVDAGIFSHNIDYLALGHLHVPQTVQGSEIMRYSGSPLPMGFGEAKQKKSLCLVDFSPQAPRVQLMDVPVFQQMEQIKGDLETIETRIAQLHETNMPVWLEIIYEGEAIVSNLRDTLERAVTGTQLEILRIKNTRVMDHVMKQCREGETLEDLDVNEVFERCLAVHEVPKDQRPELLGTYQETLTSLFEDDLRAQ